MIVHQVDEKTYFKSWSFPSSSKTSLCSVKYNYWMVLVSILITDIREIESQSDKLYLCLILYVACNE